jgi:hypothetical protein
MEIKQLKVEVVEVCLVVCSVVVETTIITTTMEIMVVEEVCLVVSFKEEEINKISHKTEMQ